MQGDTYHTFAGTITLEKIIGFARKGYLQFPAHRLSPAKGALGKFVFILKQNVDGAIRLLDGLGLERIPWHVKLVGVVFAAILPIIVVLACVWFCGESKEKVNVTNAKTKAE